MYDFTVPVDHFTCLSSRAVGTDHLSCLCNLGTAGTVRARAGLTITRRANQSVSIVTVQAVLTGHPHGEVWALTHTWNRERERERSVTITHSFYARAHLLVLVIVFHTSGLDTIRPQRVKFSPSPEECAVSLTITVATPYRYSTPQPIPVKKTKTFPIAHHGEQKTTKFTPSIIALGNIGAKCSPKDLQEEKQFPDQVEEITNSMMYLKTNCCFESLRKTTRSLTL